MLDSLFSNDTRVIVESTKKAKHLLGGGSEGHAGHCFEYLRQGIMCNGDMTLEWPKLGANGKRIEVDGWEIPHVCKSWVSTPRFLLAIWGADHYARRDWRIYAGESL
jgi:hypothetical protein